MKRIIALVMAAMLMALTGCSSVPAGGQAENAASGQQGGAPVQETAGTLTEADTESEAEDFILTPGKSYTVDHRIEFSGSGVIMDGAAVKEYDYTWNVDPAGDYEEVKNAPAEYYTGTEPDGSEAVYVAHDIFYYPAIDTDLFTLANYDGEQEWVTCYQSEKYRDYLFGTLPKVGDSVPEKMMHTAEEAADNPVLHITAPGTYELSGNWKGQVWVDLGEDSFTDPDAVVTLVLNGAKISCTVAPAIVFYQVYEADNAWEETEDHRDDVSLEGAGANIILADDTASYITGTNIYRMLKTKYKDEESTEKIKVQKKLRKTDGALYSYMSMNVDGGPQGSGQLIVNSSFEGLDTELHLALNSGCIRIESENDGINCNEDNVSTIQFNGAQVSVAAGLGEEGDGIDSNGYVLVTGGTVYAVANPAMDSGIDSELGLRVTGGEVVSLGSSMDVGNNSENSTQPLVALSFRGMTEGNEFLTLRDENGKDVIGFCQQDHEDFAELVRNYSGAVLSSPALKQGSTYQLYLGEKLLGYTTTEKRGPFGGFPGGFDGGFPGGGPEAVHDPKAPDRTEEMIPAETKGGSHEEMQRPAGMEKPEGMPAPEGGEWPEGGGRPQGMERPEGMGQPGDRPGMPEGDFPGGFPGGFPGENSEDEDAGVITDFVLNSVVNYFGGVRAGET